MDVETGYFDCGDCRTKRNTDFRMYSELHHVAVGYLRDVSTVWDMAELICCLCVCV